MVIDQLGPCTEFDVLKITAGHSEEIQQLVATEVPAPLWSTDPRLQPSCARRHFCMSLLQGICLPQGLLQVQVN